MILSETNETKRQRRDKQRHARDKRKKKPNSLDDDDCNFDHTGADAAAMGSVLWCRRERARNLGPLLAGDGCLLRASYRDLCRLKQDFVGSRVRAARGRCSFVACLRIRSCGVVFFLFFGRGLLSFRWRACVRERLADEGLFVEIVASSSLVVGVRWTYCCVDIVVRVC